MHMSQKLIFLTLCATSPATAQAPKYSDLSAAATESYLNSNCLEHDTYVDSNIKATASIHNGDYRYIETDRGGWRRVYTLSLRDMKFDFAFNILSEDCVRKGCVTHRRYAPDGELLRTSREDEFEILPHLPELRCLRALLHLKEFYPSPADPFG